MPALESTPDTPAAGDLAGVAELLIVEEDEAVRRVLARALARRGFAAQLAAGGQEAVKVYQRHRSAIRLALVALEGAAGLDGPATLTALKQLNRDLPCCLMSCNVWDHDTDALLAQGASCVLQKPLSIPQTVYLLRGLLEPPRGEGRVPL
jgi:two-component system, OmpR family, response regulator